MNLDDSKLIYISACIILVLISVSPVIKLSIPKKIEPFFTISVLGVDSKISNYFPDNNQNIETGNEIKWSIYLYNHMGESKYISVRIKLLNSTMIAPNATISKPSPYLPIYEFRRILLHNETYIYPLEWSILKVIDNNNSIIIKNIIINEEIVEANAISINGNFRFVIELWMWDTNTRDFIFGWRDNYIYGPWNQIWFNILT